jgi:hypothetical protein
VCESRGETHAKKKTGKAVAMEDIRDLKKLISDCLEAIRNQAAVTNQVSVTRDTSTPTVAELGTTTSNLSMTQSYYSSSPAIVRARAQAHPDLDTQIERLSETSVGMPNVAIRIPHEALTLT